MGKDKKYEVNNIQPCPKCGSENRVMDRILRIFTIKCSDCGWHGRSLALNRTPKNQKETTDIFVTQMKMWNKDVADELGEKRARPIRLVEVE